jgi:hypothetical protein
MGAIGDDAHAQRQCSNALTLGVRSFDEKVPLREVPIRTIYIDGNVTSHFDPLCDSVRIYVRILRFCALLPMIDVAWTSNACA